MKRFILTLLLIPILFACTPATAEPSVSAQQQDDQTILLPMIINEDAEPDKLEVGVFYYPWYQNPETDGGWWHWDGFGNPAFAPPENVQSDYYPLLGAYSSFDPAVVDQHFAWIAASGIDVVITSWWGVESPENAAVPLLLDTAVQHDLKVAFHIEPYTGRTAETLITDVAYLNQTYGSHSAFYRSNKPSRWNSSTANKGVFFVWLISAPDFESDFVEPSYWRDAIDTIHASTSGGMVIGNATEPRWLDGGHFDGLYNYATVAPADETTFSWSSSLPINSWYIPSVLPGFVGERSNIDISLPRENGQSYRDQWSAAIETPVKPFMLTITSFNEWHEGTSIEPAANAGPPGTENLYKSFGQLGELSLIHI